MFKSLWEQEITCNVTLKVKLFESKNISSIFWNMTCKGRKHDSQIVYDLTFRFWICSDSVAFFQFKYLTDQTKLQCNLAAVVVVIVWQLDLPLPLQSVPVTTNVASSIPAHGEVSWIQHYMIKCVSDLRQVGGFLWVLRKYC